MERFAIKIDNAVKSNLYNICRLCGIDHPKKVSIIDALTLLGIHDRTEDEPDLCKKIFVCVGIKVAKDDQMPQTVCQLCADKINDFFEYREMCSATNIQTRKLLGIPEEIPKPQPLPPGRKRRNNRSIGKIEPNYNEDEGESILGNTSNYLDVDVDEKKDIIGNNISFKGGTKSKLKSSGNSAGVGGRKPKTVRLSKKKTIMMDDDDVKLEELDVKTEDADEILPLAVRATKQLDLPFGSTLKIKLKKAPTSKKVSFSAAAASSGSGGLPLLKPKEPNKRERRREIDEKKSQKKRKHLSVDLPIVEFDPVSKRLKTEILACIICNQDFSDVTRLNEHLITTHSPSIFEHGCSSCGEFFKTANELKDHQIWHSLSNTLYNCPICNTTYDKLTTYTRHRSLCTQQIDDTIQPIPNYLCTICDIEFPTQNLHDWHPCYMKHNGHCMRCKRRFVKKSTLFRHAVRCEATRSVDVPVILDEQKASTLTVDSIKQRMLSGKKKKKTKNKQSVETLIKSEPEANIDDRITVNEADNLLKKTSELCMEARIELTQLSANELLTSLSTKSDRETSAVGDTTATKEPEIVATNDEKGDDTSSYHDDIADHFGDANSSSDDESAEMDADASIVRPAVLKIEPVDDNDDVILVEDAVQEPILIPADTSPIKDKAKSMPNELPSITIKQEPMDSDFINHTCGQFDPTIKIKQEPAELQNVPTNSVAVVSQTTAKRKEKKSKHKHKKEKRIPKHQTVHIKQEPTDSYPSTTDNMSVSANVSTVVHTTLNPLSNSGANIAASSLSINIKKEPIQLGYDEFDPTVALNIKQEQCDESSASPKQPSLRLKITKNHGTLNAQIIPDSSVVVPSHHPPQSSDKSAGDSDDSSLQKKRCRPKNLYKKPALLAQKIREEMLARMGKDTSDPTPQKEQPSVEPTIPVITQVSAGDGTQIPINPSTETIPSNPAPLVDFTPVQIKLEKPDDYPDDDSVKYLENTSTTSDKRNRNEKVLNPLARIRKKIACDKTVFNEKIVDQEERANITTNLLDAFNDEESENTANSLVNTIQQNYDENAGSNSEINQSITEEKEKEYVQNNDAESSVVYDQNNDPENTAIEEDVFPNNSTETEREIEEKTCSNDDILNHSNSPRLTDGASNNPSTNNEQNSEEQLNSQTYLLSEQSTNKPLESTAQLLQQQLEEISRKTPPNSSANFTNLESYENVIKSPSNNLVDQPIDHLQYSEFNLDFVNQIQQTSQASLDNTIMYNSTFRTESSHLDKPSSEYHNPFENLNGLDERTEQHQPQQNQDNRCADILQSFSLNPAESLTHYNSSYTAFSSHSIAYPENTSNQTTVVDSSVHEYASEGLEFHQDNCSDRINVGEHSENNQETCSDLQNILSNMGRHIQQPPPPPPPPLPTVQPTIQICEKQQQQMPVDKDGILEDISDDSLGDLDEDDGDKQIDWEMEDKLLNETGNEHNSSSVS